MYKVIKEGKGGIVAKIVADSINSNGNRITTFELEYHRFIHSELMTHRLFSRNAMSSRAVPVEKMIEQVLNNPATPIHWGKNQSGMQAEDEVENYMDFGQGEYQWYGAAHHMAEKAKTLMEQGYHKQIVNRLLEPFQMMKTVLTATEFENFFWLRLDKDAQPEIQELARCMYECMEESKPELIKSGQWHTPYVDHLCGVEEDSDDFGYVLCDEYGTPKQMLTEEEALAISSSCCAQVSYRNIDNSFDKAMKVYERLGVGSNKIHASPFEHVATPMQETDYSYGEYSSEDFAINVIDDSESWEKGITHVDKHDNLWSGNFKGWIQHRQLLDNHTKW